MARKLSTVSTVSMFDRICWRAGIAGIPAEVIAEIAEPYRKDASDHDEIVKLGIELGDWFDRNAVGQLRILQDRLIGYLASMKSFRIEVAEIAAAELGGKVYNPNPEDQWAPVRVYVGRDFAPVGDGSIMPRATYGEGKIMEAIERAKKLRIAESYGCPI